MNYSKIHVLVIDDDSSTRTIITRLIKQIGFSNYSEAENGHQAFDMLMEDTFGLILSDWDMPKMNGYELLEKVRAEETYKNTPFIMVTANDNKESILDAVKAKVSQYIVKPFTEKALRETIEKVVSA